MKVIVGRLMLAAALALVPARFVHSLHEIDHRYDVTGYVVDREQRPVSGVPVVGYVDGKRMGSGRSDSNGYYRFRMHLHDSDVGRELRLKTPESEGTVRVTLTRGDASTERIHHVNFIDGNLVEGELHGRGGISMSAIAAVGAGILVLGALVGAGKYRRVQRRRQRLVRQSETPRASKSSRRRNRKGKQRRR